jgi:DNA-binding protein HU-beta
LTELGLAFLIVWLLLNQQLSVLRESKLNKSELIAAVAANADISKASAGRAVDATLAAIEEALTKGDSVVFVGFGSFKVSHRAARNGRNPSTGAAIKIPARKVPVFSAGKALKDAVN